MSNEQSKLIHKLQTKLRRVAKDAHRSLSPILLLFLQERFLYRLSRSQYCDEFVLKGGLLFHCLLKLEGRPTRDIDLVAQNLPPEPKDIGLIFREICQIPNGDGVVFDADSLTVESNEKDENAVFTIKIKGTLGEMYGSIKVDLSFKGVKSVPPLDFDFPAILEEFKNPRLKIYSRESAIAEKFQVMVAFSDFNTRMKDFYDVYIFITSSSIEGKALIAAIIDVFHQRSTPFNEKLVIFTKEFAKDKKRSEQWNSFLKRSIVDLIPFERVMIALTHFLQPINVCLCNNSEFTSNWNPKKSKWES